MKQYCLLKQLYEIGPGEDSVLSIHTQTQQIKQFQPSPSLFSTSALIPYPFCDPFAIILLLAAEEIFADHMFT